MDAKQMLDGATVVNDKGVVTGIMAKGPHGNVVKLRPGSVTLAASVEKGLYLDGLKDGWQLVSAKGTAVPAPVPEKDKK